jgi:GT2 family glycosyltransferase
LQTSSEQDIPDSSSPLRTSRRVSVLVLNYNLPDLSIRCVESNRKSLLEGTRIIIVDNGSADENVEKIRGYAQDNGWNIWKSGHSGTSPDFSQVQDSSSSTDLILHATNEGYARGNNIGLAFIDRFHHADQVLVINNDVFWDTDVITGLAEGLDSDQHACYAIPRVITPGGTEQNPQMLTERLKVKQTLYRLFFPISILIYRFFSGRYDYGQHNRQFVAALDNPKNLDLSKFSFMGCCFLADMNKFRDMGFFDPDTFLGTEEQRLVHKARERGFTVILVPQVKVQHLQGETCRSMHSKTRILDFFEKSDRDYLQSYCHFGPAAIALIKFAYLYFRTIWMPLLFMMDRHRNIPVFSYLQRLFSSTAP